MSEKNKNILLGVLVVGILSMTVAFAALTTRLNIGGSTNVAATSWNVHFYNWQKVSIPTVTYGGNTHNNTAESPAVASLTMSDNSNVTKVEGVNVTLNQPGDTAKYTFEIVNDGTIDAELSNFTVTDTTSNSLVGYDVKCYANYNSQTDVFSGDELAVNSVLTANGGKVYCYLQVTYKDQTNTQTAGSNQVYNQSSTSTNLTAQWTWIQSTQANSNSGSGSQSAYTGPYATTFDGNYTAYNWGQIEDSGYTSAGELHNIDYGWYTSLNPNERAYFRTNGSILETCAVFQSGTVCLMGNGYNSDYIEAGNYYSDFSDCSDDETYDGTGTTCIKGYTKAKADEMLAKGAYECYYHGDDMYLECVASPEDSGGCSIHDAGYVECHKPDYAWSGQSWSPDYN